MQPVFFANPAELRRWLERNHLCARELWVGLHKKRSGIPSITWPQLVDELLCFGWIDGVRRSLDETRYAIRVTPRRKGSVWSRVNLGRCRELIRQGTMEPSGLAAFEGRRAEEPGEDPWQEGPVALAQEYQDDFRSNPAAWEFFLSQPPGYRKTASAWVMSAKRDETRRRRLGTLIEDSGMGRRIAPLRRP